MKIDKRSVLNYKLFNHRLKFLNLYFSHILNRRYLNIYIDPCLVPSQKDLIVNKKCIDNDGRSFNEADLQRVAKCVFKNATKIQIGYSLEPTNYQLLTKIVTLGKLFGVPHIVLRTGADAPNIKNLEALLQAGLDEFIVPCESFMHSADQLKYMNLFSAFSQLREDFDFRVKFNFTFNEHNINELQYLFRYFETDSIDILQMLPEKRNSHSEKNGYSLENLNEDYLYNSLKIKAACLRNNINVIAPDNLMNFYRDAILKTVFDYTFCYISPCKFWKDDFNWRDETFNSYSKRIKWGKTLLSNAFISRSYFKLFLPEIN